jgi:hypothetical protein
MMSFDACMVGSIKTKCKNENKKNVKMKLCFPENIAYPQWGFEVLLAHN